MHERRDLPDRLAQSGDPPRPHEDVARVRGAPVLPGGILQVPVLPLRGVSVRRPLLPWRRGIRRRGRSGPLIVVLLLSPRLRVRVLDPREDVGEGSGTLACSQGLVEQGLEMPAINCVHGLVRTFEEFAQAFG